MRIAFVGNINSKCGIAEYNQLLLEALTNKATVHFFAEKNGQENTDQITYCWNRNEFPKLDLIDQVDNFSPDIVLFSHEYGIFPKSYFYTSLVSYFKLRRYKVVSILHSVYEGHQDKLITESICKNTIVHTEKAKEVLIKKGIDSGNISVIPHGCMFGTSDKTILPKLWNHYGNDHVIVQPGFLFYYKSHLEMLDVVNELKEKYPDVLYVILGSENPLCQSEHDALHKEICEKVSNLGLTHNIIIDRGYVSNNVLMSHIRTSKVVVLPYRPGKDFDVFGSSGMARLVLQTATPLITSKANLFDGLGKVAIKCDSKQSWVDAISHIFENNYNSEELIRERATFLEENSWDNCAAKLIEICRNAV